MEPVAASKEIAMELESFDPKVLTPDEFPLTTRLYEIVRDGALLDDVVAGIKHGSSRLDVLFEHEITAMLNKKKDYATGAVLCAAFLKHSVEEFPRTFFTGNLGHSYEKLGEFGTAREYAKRTLDIAESTDQTWGPLYVAWCCNQIGFISFLEGKHAEGAEWAERAIEVNPDMNNAYGTLGQCLYELDDDRAFEVLEKALKRGVKPRRPARLRNDLRFIQLAEKHGVDLNEES